MGKRPERTPGQKHSSTPSAKLGSMAAKRRRIPPPPACRHCGAKIEAVAIRAHAGPYGVIFAKTVPALLCPTCDRAPDPLSDDIHRRLAA